MIGDVPMISYAGIVTHENDAKYGIGNACGAHFSRSIDPEDPSRKVLRVEIHNTITVLNSFTSISCTAIAKKGNTYEFQMDFRFDRLRWLYSPRYQTVEFRNSAGTKLLGIRFDVKNYTAGLPAEEMVMNLDDGTLIDGTSISCDRWYTIKFEYYYNNADYKLSHLKIYIAERGKTLVCRADISAYLRAGKISSAVIVHHATKVRGVLYYDNISFLQSDKRYSAKDRHIVIGEECPGAPVYNFENAIPSSDAFKIRMVLKSDDTVVPFDPAKRTGGTGAPFMHSHGLYEIMLVVSGCGVLVTESAEYPFDTGSILIVPPNILHGVISDEHKLFSVSGSFERLNFIDNVVLVRDNVYKEGKKLASLILYNRFGNEEYLESLGDAYVKYIMMNMEMSPKNTAASIYGIISKMEKNFSDSTLRIGELLRESGYAEDYIRAEFLALTKYTPTQYLTSIRMKNAKMMINLFGSSISISEIAEKCGILDIPVFSRMFKKYYGISPTQYKKTIFNSKSK